MSLKTPYIFFLLGAALGLVIGQQRLISYLYSKFTSTTKTTHSDTQATLKHLGIIMDGNRRWAREQGQMPWLGHKQGVTPVKTTVRFCLDTKIEYLTLYAFSLENFKRPQKELDYLFNVLAQEIENSELEELFKQGVQVRFAGDRALFPEQLRKTVASIESKTKNNTRLVLTILFCYGGQQEILYAAKQLARSVEQGTLTSDAITEELFERELWTGKMPPVDLIIRTGKNHRLSNFLTYYSAYSELYFLDCYWPEVTEKHLATALDYFIAAKRTFGG